MGVRIFIPFLVIMLSSLALGSDGIPSIDVYAKVLSKISSPDFVVDMFRKKVGFWKIKKNQNILK